MVTINTLPAEAARIRPRWIHGTGRQLALLRNVQPIPHRRRNAAVPQISQGRVAGLERPVGRRCVSHWLVPGYCVTALHLGRLCIDSRGCWRLPVERTQGPNYSCSCVSSGPCLLASSNRPPLFQQTPDSAGWSRSRYRQVPKCPLPPCCRCRARGPAQAGLQLASIARAPSSVASREKESTVL